ncbi:MAG TPA: nuclear transport factor 2 family protein [Gaiella sp.]
MPPIDLERLARAFFGAYGEGDLETVRALLAEDAVVYVTNAEGGVDRVAGRDRAMARLPDLTGAEWSTQITQVAVVDEERVMTMIEVRAARKGKELHNYAAFLARVSAERISDLWMVEALPAYSDEFWS